MTKSQVFGHQIFKCKPRMQLTRLVALCTTLCSPLIIWSILRLVMNVDSPIMVVLGTSMQRGFYKGDLLLIINLEREVIPGDIVAFKIPGQPIPIIHRVMSIQDKLGLQNGKDYNLLTNGDHNVYDDRLISKSGKI